MSSDSTRSSHFTKAAATRPRWGALRKRGREPDAVDVVGLAAQLNQSYVEAQGALSNAQRFLYSSDLGEDSSEWSLLLRRFFFARMGDSDRLQVLGVRWLQRLRLRVRADRLGQDLHHGGRPGGRQTGGELLGAGRALQDPCVVVARVIDVDKN